MSNNFTSIDDLENKFEEKKENKFKVVGKIVKESFKKDPITTTAIGVGCVWATGYFMRSIAQLINSLKWKKYKNTSSTLKK